MRLQYKLHDHVFINQVDNTAIAYSSLSNEMVVLHPLTQAVLVLLEGSIPLTTIVKKIEQMDVEIAEDIVLEEFIHEAVKELVLTGFVMQCG